MHAHDQGDTATQSVMKIAQLVTSVCNLLAKAVTKPRVTEPYVTRPHVTRPHVLSPEEWVVQALSLDGELARCQAALPTDVFYRTVLSNDPDPTIHAGYYYIWPNQGCAVFFLPYWMVAILLHGLMVQQLERLYASQEVDSDGIVSYYALQMQRSATTIASCIGHICASVHYHLSICQSLASSGGSSSDSPPLPCAASINAILKPLFVAGDSVFCPLATRAWIVEQLRFIGLEMGVRQALFLADVIVQKGDTEDWLLSDRG